jgi:lysophospholipase L1-like esterase
MNPSGAWIPIATPSGIAFPGAPPSTGLYGSSDGGATWFPLQCDASGNLAALPAGWTVTGTGSSQVVTAPGSLKIPYYLAVGTPFNLTNYPGTGFSVSEAAASGGYEQAIMQDQTPSGQGCWIAQSDDGTNATHYAEFCMNNSVAPNPANVYFTNPHAATVYNADGEFDIAAGLVTGGTPAGAINFYVDNTSPQGTGPVAKITSSGIAAVNQRDVSNPLLQTYNAALHNAANAPVSIVFMMDSYANCGGLTLYVNCDITQVQRYLQTKFGSHGTGLITPVAAGGIIRALTVWTTNPAMGPTQTGYGTNFNTLYDGTVASNSMCTTTAQYTDHWNIYYATFTDTASGFGVTVDGGGATTYGATTSGSYTAAVQNISVAAGYHNICVVPPASGKVHIYALQGIVGTTGVEVSILGNGGAVSASLATAPAAQMAFLSVMTPVPQLFIVTDNVNEAGNSVPVATYTANMGTILTQLATLSTPGPSVLMLDEANASTGESGSVKQSALRVAEESIAQLNNLAFVSMAQRWGTYANANSLALMNGDGIHPSDKGHLDTAAMILERIDENANNYQYRDGASNLFIGSIPNFINNYMNTGLGLGGSGGTGNSTNYQNTWAGYQSCSAITTGHNNVCIGRFAGGNNLSSGSSNVAIGDGSGLKTAGDGNEDVIGSGAVGNGSNTATIGNSSLIGTWLKGTMHFTGTAPDASAGSVTGSNAGGTIASLTAATTTTLTFNTASPWTVWSSCTASASAAATPVQVSAISLTAVTFTFAALTGSVYYQCNGN